MTKQAADAKEAVSRVISDLQRDLVQTIDPRAWMQVRPWTTLGATAVAAFVATSLAVPSKEDQALKRLKAIEKALTPHAHVPLSDGETNGDGVKKAQQSGGFLAGLAGQILRAVQPVLMSAITAGVTAKTVEKDEPTGGADPSTYASGQSDSRGADPEI